MGERPYAATAAAAAALIWGDMLCNPAAYAAAPAAPASSPFIPAGCGSIPKAPGYGPGTAMGVRKPAAMQENQFKLKPPRAFKKKKF